MLDHHSRVTESSSACVKRGVWDHLYCLAFTPPREGLWIGVCVFLLSEPLTFPRLGLGRFGTACYTHFFGTRYEDRKNWRLGRIKGASQWRMGHEGWWDREVLWVEDVGCGKCKGD